MEKLGVKKDILYEDLRNEEAMLMQAMQHIVGNPAKTASDRTGVESRLQQVRQKITELDMVEDK